MMKALFGKVLLGAAFVSCPCHFPIYLLLFGGTALGSYFAANTALVLVALTLTFLLSLGAGLRMVRAARPQE